LITRLLYIIFFTLLVGNIGAQQKEWNELPCNFHLKHLLQNSHPTDMVGLFVKGSSADAKEFCSTQQGLYRGSVQGWQFIRIPVSSIPALIKDNRFSSIDYAPYKGEAMNDTMRVNNRINPIHQGQTPLHSPYTGQGIIMGFIDTGIDFRHPDFRTSNDRTRVLHLWDQTLSNNGYTPTAYGYGRNWDSTQINAGLANTHTDQWGHGSTVAGAGAGNGLATGTHKGVAPDAYIIAVESRFNAADWLSTVVDATKYIYAKADQHNMPCVINASVGTYLGSHDGLDPYALYIDSIVAAKKGRLFVASAGNGGLFEPYHVRNEITPDTTFTWFKNNPSSGFGGPAAFWEIWADTANFNQVNYGVAADTPWPSYSLRGRTTLFKNIHQNLNTLLRDTIWSEHGNRIATVQYWAQQRDGQYLVQVYMPTPDSANYLFRFETVGIGAYDCWSRQTYGMSAMVDTLPDVSQFPFLNKYVLPDTLQSIVSSFQCGKNVISVGNYVNDSGYVNKFNNWIATDQPRGKLALTSSLGPTRDGRIKPELAATGHNTLSTFPLSLINTINNNPPQDTSLALGGMHRSNGGTSMSSPVVAGVGAILLEKCPHMDMATFKELLINNTYSDEHTGILPNVAFGYGKLDGIATIVGSNFTPNYIGSLNFCANDSALIELDADYTNYFWNDNSTNATNYFSSPQLAQAWVINSNGCKSDTLYLAIIQNSKPQIINLEQHYNFCENTPFSTSLSGTFQSVIWSDGITLINREFDDTFIGYVLAYDSAGCLSDTNNLEIVKQLSPEITCYGAPYNVCEGSFISIDLLENTDNTLLWSDNQTDNPREFNSDFIGSVALISPYGCISIPCIVEVISRPIPEILCIADTLNFCQGGSIVIDLIGNEENTALWSDGFTTNPREFSTDFSGNAVIINPYSCISEPCDFEIISRPVPIQPMISHSFDTLSVVDSFTAYQWYLNGASLLDAETHFFVANVNGNYTLSVFNEFGCVITSLPYLYQGVGLTELNSNVTLFPNPTHGEVYVVIGQNESFTYTIFDLNGRLIGEGNSENSSIIQLNHLENGLYTVHISTNKYSIVQKIILNK
jgi:hypothetical protein